MDSANRQQRAGRPPILSLSAAQQIDEPPSASIYSGMILAHWRLIVIATLLAVLATALITGLLMTRWYQAVAVIRPTSDSQLGRQMSLGGDTPLQGLGEAVLGGGLSEKAEEYVAILNGFAFSERLASSRGLGAELLKTHRWTYYAHDPRWDIYRTLQRRFGAEYSYRTDLITLRYAATSRQQAEEILGYYISDLRAQLREREVTSTGLAIKAMNEQVSHTADTLLLSRLYQLIAEQVKRNRLAQVQADYSFTVIDPPSASDRPYRPAIVVDCLLAALITPFAVALLIIMFAARPEPIELEAVGGEAVGGRAGSRNLNELVEGGTIVEGAPEKGDLRRG